MLVIRLARVGRENLQQFRLVVQEKTFSPKSGKVVATVGSYNPTDPDNKLTFDAEKIEQFIKNGAAPSDTVARLLMKNGFKKELVEKFVEKYTKQKSKKEASEEGAADAAAKPAAAPTAEAPADAEKKEGEAKTAPAADKPAEEAKAPEAEAKPEDNAAPAEEEKKDS